MNKFDKKIRRYQNMINHYERKMKKARKDKKISAYNDSIDGLKNGGTIIQFGHHIRSVDTYERLGKENNET